MVAIAPWGTMTGRDRCVLLADVLAAALAAVLPWSTSATTILVWLWLVAVIPTLDVARLRRVLMTPAGGLPVLFVVLGLIGMLWAFDVPMKERWGGFGSFYRFLFIPLLIAHFCRSGRGSWVVIGFIVSCATVQVVSWMLIADPSLRWPIYVAGGPGIPVRDYIAQSGEFIVCAFLLAALALTAWQNERRWLALALALLVVSFLFNVIAVTSSRTGIVVIPVLLLLFAWQRLSWKGFSGLVLVAAVLAGLAVAVSPRLQDNVAGVLGEVRDFDPQGQGTRAGERLEYWKKSIGFIATAPLIGHGTGSIRDQFRRTVAGQTGMAAMASSNPHNQTFAVAVQLGLLGTVVLFAMWIAHVLVFRGSGFVAWAGLVIVVQNIVSSLFNSHLFDFTQGWGYVIGVGVAAGMAFKEQGTPAMSGREPLRA